MRYPQSSDCLNSCENAISITFTHGRLRRWYLCSCGMNCSRSVLPRGGPCSAWFFANLTAGDPGELWGPRMYTVLPITLILFFAYAQLGPGEQVANNDRRLHFDMLLASLGTGTVVALLYFH